MNQTKIMRALHYNNKYGITIRIYNKMLAKQKECCAICGRNYTQFDRHFDVDENSFTHLPRGLLCAGCNRNVGKYEHKQLKNLNLIEKIENYLAKYD